MRVYTDDDLRRIDRTWLGPPNKRLPWVATYRQYVTIIVAGLTPTIAAWLVEATDNIYMPAYYLMIAATVGLATTLFLKETANRPLYGDTPNASNRKEAKALLAEHYLYIEESVEKIDEAMDELREQIELLQKKRDRLVEQHPKLT